jgi:hypothetical protein
VDLCPGSEIYFDNLFTSFPLLEKLSEMQLAGTGTVRQNKLNRIPIVKKKDLEKQDRGTSEVLYQDDKVRQLFSLFECTVIFRILYCTFTLLYFSTFTFNCCTTVEKINWFRFLWPGKITKGCTWPLTSTTGRPPPPAAVSAAGSGSRSKSLCRTCSGKFI